MINKGKLIDYWIDGADDDFDTMIAMFDSDKIFTAVYYDGEQKKYYVKRFQLPENTSINKSLNFIGEEKGSKLIAFSLDYLPRLQFDIKKDGSTQTEVEVVPLADFIAIKGYKAKGKRLSNYNLRKVKLIEPLPYTPQVAEEIPENISEEETELKEGNETDIEIRNEYVVSDSENNNEDASDKNKVDPPVSDEETMNLDEKKEKGKPPYTNTDDPPQLELDF